MVVSATLGFMLYSFVKQSLSDECEKHETQGHRHYQYIYIYIYIYMIYKPIIS